MSDITLTAPDGKPTPELLDAKKLLEAAGHTVTFVDAPAAQESGDPFLGVDLDTIPKAVWANLGISREEIERGRLYRPAIERGHGNQATAPALEAEPAAG